MCYWHVFVGSYLGEYSNITPLDLLIHCIYRVSLMFYKSDYLS